MSKDDGVAGTGTSKEADSAPAATESAAIEQPVVADSDGKGSFGRILALIFVVIALVFGGLAAAGKLQPLFQQFTGADSGSHEGSGEQITAADTEEDAAPALKAASTQSTDESVHQVVKEQAETPHSDSHETSPAEQQVAATTAESTGMAGEGSEPLQSSSVPVSEPAAVSTDVQTDAAQVAQSDVQPVVQADAGQVAIPDAQTDARATSLAEARATAQAEAVRAAVEAETGRLTATIDQLSSALASMRQQQGVVQKNQASQHQLAVQMRLNQLTMPAVSLQQMQQIWGEIALLPGLSDAERLQARKMHALATDIISQAEQWRNTLIHWADSLEVTENPDVLPKPEHPWLAWMVSQFHVYKSASQDARDTALLRKRLLNAGRQLEVANWPDQATWQSLYAALVVQIQKSAAAQGKVAPEPGLPATLASLQEGVSRLHETALRWKSAGGEES